MPEMLLIVQLIEITPDGAALCAGQLHRIGQYLVTGLFSIELPCVVLPDAFQENVTLPKTVCPRGPGHPKQGLIHGLIAGGVPMDNAFVNVKVILISSIFQYLAGSHGFDVRLVRRVDLCTALALDGHFYLDQSCTGIFILHSRRFLVQTAGDHIGCVGTVDRQLGVHLTVRHRDVFTCFALVGDDDQSCLRCIIFLGDDVINARGDAGEAVCTVSCGSGGSNLRIALHELHGNAGSGSGAVGFINLAGNAVVFGRFSLFCIERDVTGHGVRIKIPAVGKCCVLIPAVEGVTILRGRIGCGQVAVFSDSDRRNRTAAVGIVGHGVFLCDADDNFSCGRLAVLLSNVTTHIGGGHFTLGGGLDAQRGCDGDTVVFVCHNSSDIAPGLRADNGDRCPDRHIAHGKYTEGTGGNGQLTVALNGKCTLAHNTGADIGTQGGPNCGAVVHGVLRTLLRGDARIGRQENRASALYIRLR